MEITENGAAKISYLFVYLFIHQHFSLKLCMFLEVARSSVHKIIHICIDYHQNSCFIMYQIQCVNGHVFIFFCELMEVLATSRHDLRHGLLSL